METSELVRNIIEKEWDLFQQTQNVGGRASCQDNPGTFSIMRGSQFACWSREALASYAADLDQAIAEGRNPVTEKYAYMMKNTHPRDFAEIESLLPPVSEHKRVLVEEIVAINVVWEEECDRLFPHVRSQGRPLRTSQDSSWATSFETYLRGELCTYSERTLSLLKEHLMQAVRDKVNLARTNLDHMARSYGYPSIEALEQAKAAR